MNLLVLPVLVPLGTAAVMLLAPKRALAQRWIALAGSTGLLGSGVALFSAVNAGGIHALQVSGWPAPFGIVCLEACSKPVCLDLSAPCRTIYLPLILARKLRLTLRSCRRSLAHAAMAARALAEDCLDR